jgi:hypothetical protein
MFESLLLGIEPVTALTVGVGAVITCAYCQRRRFCCGTGF